MTKKVTLPTEVAKAIEELRGEGLSSYGIITGMNKNGQGAFNTINQWSYKNGCRNTDKVLSAVINGYEVEKDFSKITDPEIYLGLIALSLDDDEHDWFLVGAAKAFIQNSNLVIELLEELTIARDANYQPAEWCKGNNSPGPVAKSNSFTDGIDSEELKTRQEYIAGIEDGRRRIEGVKDQKASRRVYVDEVMKNALNKFADESRVSDEDA